jgi:hypothetical protein
MYCKRLLLCCAACCFVLRAVLSGVRKVFNATTCKETNGCYEWKGTDKSCTFKFSGPDKCCREAEGVCDVPEFCKWQGLTQVLLNVF